MCQRSFSLTSPAVVVPPFFLMYALAFLQTPIKLFGSSSRPVANSWTAFRRSLSYSTERCVSFCPCFANVEGQLQVSCKSSHS